MLWCCVSVLTREANTAQGVKARLGAWQEKVQKAEDGDLPDNSKLAEERVSEVRMLDRD